MQSGTVVVGFTALALGTAGCSTVFKQAYYGVRGAQGKFYEIQVVDPGVIATYESAQVEPFTNELGERLPVGVLEEVNAETPDQIKAKNLFYDQGKRLVISGRVVHYTGKSSLTGSVGSVIGGGEECVCRVQLKDAESGEPIGEAVCWGVVKSAVRRGSGELGKGVGKGVAEWISKRFPPDVRKERRKELGEIKEDD